MNPTEQPDPVPNDSTPVWDLVIADMHARDHVGRQRYGVPLQAGNGRDCLRDLYEELLDACVYLRQTIAERDGQRTDRLGPPSRPMWVSGIRVAGHPPYRLVENLTDGSETCGKLAPTLEAAREQARVFLATGIVCSISIYGADGECVETLS